MSKDQGYQHAHTLSQITRRSVLLGGIGLAGLTTLASRMYYLQFIRSEQFRTLAEGNRIKLIVTPPSRGLIHDRTHAPLAENRKNFRLFLEIDKNPDALKTLEKLKQWIEFPSAKYTTLYDTVRVRRYGPPILLMEDLSWEQVVAVEHHAPQLPGAAIEVGQRRFYPLAEETAHVLGYVATISPEEKAKSDYYRWPEPQIGKQGTEKSWEEPLRGKPGLLQMEVNVKGLSIRKLKEEPSIAGETIRSSLHHELQRYTYELLMQNISGAAIIMNVRNGEVLALASAPSFDSNVMAAGISSKDWNVLRDSEKKPLLNKATIGQYPPGSTFKMVTGLAALHHKGISPHRTIYCPGHFYLGNHRFNCWKPEGHGAMNLEHALAESCDTYFYTLGHEMGIDPISDIGRKLGLGAPTGIDLPVEKGGLMPSHEWKMKSYNQPWQKGDTVNAAIGQGYILTTPLQLALMTARLVNGGMAIKPRLTYSGEAVTSAPPLDIDPEHLKAIITGMEAVANKPFGTAYWKRIMEPAFAMGGKTGTAQVRRITIRGQDQNRVPWKFRHHALFVGYAPIHDPRYAVSVVIEHGGGGSSTAAPVARDLLQKTQELMG